MIKIGFGGGKGKPQVGYPTAMDVFVIICLLTVFASLCEFAILNFISVTLSRRKAREQEMKEAEEKAKELIEIAGKVDRQQQKYSKTSSEKFGLVEDFFKLLSGSLSRSSFSPQVYSQSVWLGEGK